MYRLSSYYHSTIKTQNWSKVESTAHVWWISRKLGLCHEQVANRSKRKNVSGIWCFDCPAGWRPQPWRVRPAARHQEDARVRVPAVQQDPPGVPVRSAPGKVHGHGSVQLAHRQPADSQEQQGQRRRRRGRQRRRRRLGLSQRGGQAHFGEEKDLEVG